LDIAQPFVAHTEVPLPLGVARVLPRQPLEYLLAVAEGGQRARQIPLRPTAYGQGLCFMMLSELL